MFIVKLLSVSRDWDLEVFNLFKIHFNLKLCLCSTFRTGQTEQCLCCAKSTGVGRSGVAQFCSLRAGGTKDTPPAGESSHLALIFTAALKNKNRASLSELINI